jgi:hypothetical protein
MESRVKSSLSSSDLILNTLNLNTHILDSSTSSGLDLNFLNKLNSIGFHYKILRFNPLTITLPSVKAEYILGIDNKFTLKSNSKTLRSFLTPPKYYTPYSKSSGSLTIKSFRGAGAVASEGLDVPISDLLIYRDLLAKYNIFRNHCIEIGRSYNAINSSLDENPLLLKDLIIDLDPNIDFEFKDGAIHFTNTSNDFNFKFSLNSTSN